MLADKGLRRGMHRLGIEVVDHMPDMAALQREGARRQRMR